MKKLSVVSAIVLKIFIFTLFIHPSEMNARGPWSMNRRKERISTASKTPVYNCQPEPCESEPQPLVHIYEDEWESRTDSEVISENTMTVSPNPEPGETPDIFADCIPYTQGWQSKKHPVIVEDETLIAPLSYHDEGNQPIYDLPVMEIHPAPDYVVGQENVVEIPEGIFSDCADTNTLTDADAIPTPITEKFQTSENFVTFDATASKDESTAKLEERLSSDSLAVPQNNEKKTTSKNPLDQAKGNIRVVNKSHPVLKEGYVGSDKTPKETKITPQSKEVSIGATHSKTAIANKNFKKIREDDSLIAQEIPPSQSRTTPATRQNEPLIRFPGYQPTQQADSPSTNRLPVESPVSPTVPLNDLTQPAALPSSTQTPNLTNPTQQPIITPQRATTSVNPNTTTTQTPNTSTPIPRITTNPSTPSVPTPTVAPSTVINNNSNAAPGIPRNPAPNSPVGNPSSPHLTEVSINFNNVAMIEYIRFISRIANKNFIFDDEDLQFSVTIVSEQPTTVENLMTALLQELRIRDLLLIEQDNNLIIHRNPRVRSPARIVSEASSEPTGRPSELVTRVFRLNTLDPVRASEITRPLLSDDALIEIVRDTNTLIITDLTAAVEKIAQLIAALDAPNNGIIVGQYVVVNSFADSLVELTNQILQPIAQGNPYVLVPHASSNSIYIVSNPYLVEKAMVFLQNLDSNEGKSKIIDLDRRLRSEEEARRRAEAAAARQAGLIGPDNIEFPIGTPGGAGGITSPGAPTFPAGPNAPGSSIPSGGISSGGIEGQTIFTGRYPPGTRLGTNGLPVLGPNGQPIVEPPAIFQGGITTNGGQSGIFGEGGEFLPGGFGTNSRYLQEVPTGRIERTLFFIYKLRYRRGDQIEIALRRIADTLFLTGTVNADLVAAINSIQWIESSNSLVATGTASALERIKELILEIDIPLRQVFIEMLVLDTSLSDSLNYGVDTGLRFGGGNTAGGESFTGLGALPPVLSTGNVFNTNSINNIVGPGTTNIGLPQADGLLGGGGFSLGIVGRHLTHNGTQFNTIGALVTAIHSDAKTNIIMNPKVITEDNNTAEIFVGETDRYKTQSIANGLGSVITNNFQFIDVGTTLRVTPLIGNNGLITLDIIEEITNGGGAAANVGGGSLSDVNLVPVLSKNRTTTRVHVPNGFFVILSGMLRDQQERIETRTPCLGGIPIVGTLFKTQLTRDQKRNLMIFIRPLIVDTEEELENLTRRQQDMFREKTKTYRSWNYEIDEALNWANIRKTDPDEVGCEN